MVGEALGEHQDAGRGLAGVDAGDDGLGDRELGMGLDDVDRRPGNREVLEVRDPVGFEPPVPAADSPCSEISCSNCGRTSGWHQNRPTVDRWTATVSEGNGFSAAEGNP